MIQFGKIILDRVVIDLNIMYNNINTLKEKSI